MRGQLLWLDGFVGGRASRAGAGQQKKLRVECSRGVARLCGVKGVLWRQIILGQLKNMHGMYVYNIEARQVPGSMNHSRRLLGETRLG